MKPIEEYLIAGKFDLLPRAKNIPIGKHNINAKADTMNVKDNPPQAPVSTYFKPKLPIGRKAIVIIKNIIKLKIFKIFLFLFFKYNMKKTIKNKNKKFVGIKIGPKILDK